MLNILKIISRNKIFYAFLILIVIMFPSTIYMNSDKDKTVIITTIGLDKEENEYKLSALAVIPKGSNDVNANLEVFEGEGDSIIKAFDDIASNIGKNIGLAHCDCIILSDKIMTENMIDSLDFFIRTANLSTNAALVSTDGKAKDLLEATKSSNNLLDLSIKSIVTFEEDRSLLDNVNVEKFYRHYLTKGSTFCLPQLSTSTPEKEAQVSAGSGSGSEDNEPADSSGESSGSSSNQKKIKNSSEIIVTKLGKQLRTLTEEEKFIYNLISKDSKNLSIKVEDISDRYVTHSTEIYQQKFKFIWPKYTFIDGKPTINYYINISLQIDEIIGSNYTYSSIDSQQNFISSTVEKNINKQIADNLSITLSKMKEDKIDILDVYSKFNAYCHSDWQNYLDSLENIDDYLSELAIDIKVDYNFVI